MARPLKEINWNLVLKKMEAGCPAKEIYGDPEIDINIDTFYDRFKREFKCRFSDYSDKIYSHGEGNIRSMLYAKALNNKAPGNAQLLMFLARCRLGMREPEVAQNIAANQQQIDQTHIIMQLQHRISELEAQIANKPETE